MGLLDDKTCRARYLTHRGRNGEALATLLGVQLPNDATPDELVRYYGLRGAMRITIDQEWDDAISDLRRALTIAHDNKVIDELFVWLTRYNLGLALVLANRTTLGQRELDT
jgi:hypothetical protein